MKTFCSVILFFAVISSAHATSPEVPKIFFSYSWLYDITVCEQTPPNANWVDEIRMKSNRFSDLWSAKGPELFGILFNKTGLGFSRKEMTATFSVCPKKASYSNPLVLNMTRYLESYMSPKLAFSDDDFVDLVFHELLHTWVVENLKNSELLRKYKDEMPTVKNHMHLMAIQKFVYSKLGRTDLVNQLDRIYSKMGGTYARSWEIVQIEGDDVFVMEFPVSNTNDQ